MQPAEIHVHLTVESGLVLELFNEYGLHKVNADLPVPGYWGYCEADVMQLSGEIADLLTEDVNFLNNDLSGVDSRYYHILLGMIHRELNSTFKVLPELRVNFRISEARCYLLISMAHEEYLRCLLR